MFLGVLLDLSWMPGVPIVCSQWFKIKKGELPIDEVWLQTLRGALSLSLSLSLSDIAVAKRMALVN
jgi:hypothetical protein